MSEEKLKPYTTKKELRMNFFRFLTYIVVASSIIASGCGRMSDVMTQKIEQEKQEKYVEIIGTTTPREVPGMSHAGTRLLYVGPDGYDGTGDGEIEVFAVEGHPGVSVGSTLRIGIGYEPTVATLTVEGDPNLIPRIVYIGIRRDLIEDLRFYDGVEIRLEVHMPSGAFLNNNSLVFTPGHTKPVNPEVLLQPGG